MTHKWHEVADALAAAMQHSEKGFCTLTNNEHAALALYHEARKPGRAFVRTMLGLTGGLDAFNHSDHAPKPQFEATGDGPVGDAIPDYGQQRATLGGPIDRDVERDIIERGG